jgi:[CysO sulfur-carrier protein]-S-L-cysteine hydrolase
MIQTLTLSRTLLNEMISYVDQRVPFEACGLLAGHNDQAELMIGVLNQAQSPVRFVMDPYEQLRAFDWIDAHELDLIGIFHSHPTGPGTVSATDIAEAAYPVVHIILSRTEAHWQARGFWVEADQAHEVTLQVIN